MTAAAATTTTFNTLTEIESYLSWLKDQINGENSETISA